MNLFRSRQLSALQSVETQVRQMPKSAVLVGISLGLVYIITACSTNLDIDKVKASIKDGIKEQMGITVQSVTCPEKHEAKAGDSFDCTALAENDSTITVSVKQTDDKGNIHWDMTGSKGFLDLDKIQTQMVDTLKAKTGTEATVDCGGKFKAVKVGGTFECKAKDVKGNSATIEVTVKDNNGNVHWEVK